MKSRVLARIAILALIVAVIVLLVVQAGGNAASDREIPGMGTPDFVLIGSDDTLYLFTGDNVTALDSSGNLQFRYSVPAGWSICHRWYMDASQWYVDSIGRGDTGRGSQIACADNGTLYLYLKPDDYPADAGVNESGPVAYYGAGKLVAIGPDGLQKWDAGVTSLMVRVNKWHGDSGRWSPDVDSDASIQIAGGRIFVFHGYNESVYDSDGRLLWTIGNVSDPGTVDDAGNLYVVDAIRPLPGDAVPKIGLQIGEAYLTCDLPDYRVPGSIVDSYYPNGTQRWRQYSADPCRRQYSDAAGSSRLPLYNDGIVYALSEESITAIGDNGSKLWVKRFDRNDYPFLPSDTGMGKIYPPEQIPPEAYEGGDFQAYWVMPFDSRGNLYVIHTLSAGNNRGNRWSPGSAAYIIVVAPDGREVSSHKATTWDFPAVAGNVGYRTVIEYADVLPGSGRSLNDLYTGTLVAYDPGTDRPLWNFTVPTNRQTMLVISGSNYNSLITEHEAEMLGGIYNHSANLDFPGLFPGTVPSGGVYGEVSLFDVRPGNGVIYLDFRTHNFDYPIVLNQSRYVHSGGVYAVATNGTLLWYVPMSPDTSVISATNSTIIYNTWDGKTYAKALGAIAGGVALVSGAYLAFYFFAGTVTRARGRVDKNNNRTAVFEYVRQNPGSTLYEIARGTGINIGTVRYHLYILGINHRIVAHEAGEKFVRYFTNAGSYDDRERTIISLMRRDVTGKVLRLIAERPGIGNADIARELGIHESVAHRSIKELVDMGVLTREAAGRGYAYMLTDADRSAVIRSVEKVDGHATL